MKKWAVAQRGTSPEKLLGLFERLRHEAEESVEEQFRRRLH